MEFSRPESWSGQAFPSPGDLPNPGIEPRSPALQVNSLAAEPWGKPQQTLDPHITSYTYLDHRGSTWHKVGLGWTWALPLPGCVMLCGRLSHSVMSSSLQSHGLYSLPGSSVHGIFQARILEWVAISYSKGSFWCRDWTHVSYISCSGRWILYHCTSWEACVTVGQVRIHVMFLSSAKWGK